VSSKLACDWAAVQTGVCTQEEADSESCDVWVPGTARCFKDICVEQDVLRFSLNWRAPVNLELLVTDPNGTQYSYARNRGSSTTTKSGLEVTMGSCGGPNAPGCGTETTDIPVENITFDAPGEGVWKVSVFAPTTLQNPVDYSIEVEDTENQIRHAFTGVIKELNQVDNFGENQYE
jgi:hypothetical protein